MTESPHADECKKKTLFPFRNNSWIEKWSVLKTKTALLPRAKPQDCLRCNEPGAWWEGALHCHLQAEAFFPTVTLTHWCGVLQLKLNYNHVGGPARGSWGMEGVEEWKQHLPSVREGAYSTPVGWPLTSVMWSPGWGRQQANPTPANLWIEPEPHVADPHPIQRWPSRAWVYSNS